ncbi:MAG: hypothetical protein L6Q92_10365 [Phycisphaerae bacterium]|nr:hypothetical protein [Phycisphaerae bacterium]
MIEHSLKTRGHHVGVRFAPPAVFDKVHRQEFQLRLSQGFDWRHQEFAERMWVLSSPQAEGDPRSHMKLTLQPDLLNFEEFFPVATLDVFLDNLRLVLNEVAGVFSPRIILGSGTLIRMTLEAEGGDARVFLGNRYLRLSEKLAVLGRPVHGVGLKLILPPISAEGQPTWHAEVKVESLLEDVRQIFVELDAKWGTPTAWSPDVVIERVRIAQRFATTELLKFISQSDAP